MRCEDCGGAICVRTNHYKNQKRFYTFCVRNHHSHKIACSGHNVNYEKLENYVLETLKKTLNNTIVNYEKIMANLKDKNTENLKNIQKLKNEVIILKSKKEKAYQDRLEDIISAEEYLKYAKNLDNEIDKINEQILDLKNQKSDNLNIEDLKKWLLNLEKPDKLLLKILIKKITINENKEIKIYLNFATN